MWHPPETSSDNWWDAGIWLATNGHVPFRNQLIWTRELNLAKLVQSSWNEFANSTRLKQLAGNTRDMPLWTSKHKVKQLKLLSLTSEIPQQAKFLPSVPILLYHEAKEEAQYACLAISMNNYSKDTQSGKIRSFSKEDVWDISVILEFNFFLQIYGIYHLTWHIYSLLKVGNFLTNNP